jgi:hypothetical protein
MPKRIPWKEVVLAAAETDEEQILDGLKAYDVNKSHTMSCTLFSCPSDLHKMRYRLLACSSNTYKDESISVLPDYTCIW